MKMIASSVTDIAALGRENGNVVTYTASMGTESSALSTDD
jgi:hypothetical protein